MSWQRDIFLEGSLWDTYKKSPDWRSNRFNRVVLVGAILLSVSLTLADVLFGTPYKGKVTEIITAIRSWLEIGVSFSLGTLGFLVAGFTIFATVSRPELFIHMAQTAYKESGLSQFKWVFFVFLNVFVNYISYLSFSIVLLFVVRFVMEIKGLRDLFSLAPASFKIGAVYSVLIVYFVWTVLLILKLKSFVWNIYSTIRISIVYHDVVS